MELNDIFAWILQGISYLHYFAPANVSDDKGLIEIVNFLDINFQELRKVNTKKITILLDNGYHKEKLEKELKGIYPQIEIQRKLLFFQIMAITKKNQRKN